MISAKKKNVNRKKNKPVALQTTTALDVFGINDGAVSVAVEVSRISFVNNPFGNRESRLKVLITNAGEVALTDLALEALSPEGTDLVDPGALFGNARRYVRVKSLSPRQKITYKLGIRARDGFSTGALVIRLTRVQALAKHQTHEMRVALIATDVN